jgi:transposase InsO family protein
VRFLKALIAAVPCRLHTVLTDNGIQIADFQKSRWLDRRSRVHRFDQVCRANGIEQRLTKPNHPWTNSQVERMNRTIKETTVNRQSRPAPSALGRFRYGLQLRSPFQDPERLQVLRVHP